MKNPETKVIAAALAGARKATAYLSPTLTIKATRQRRLHRRDRASTLIVTIGTPNHEERAFIKTCRKAGVALPLRKVQLKFYPAKKRKR